MGAKMSRNLPLVVILGPTGSGKTKLSLEVAAKFGGEIIGADSMQVYKGLNIASAKATPQEQSLTSHHLINILEPHEMFTVLEYRNRALPIIDGLFKSGKLPIVVGGTNYYIESILWKILVQGLDEEVTKEQGLLPNNYHELSSPLLHARLKDLDPAMARRLHPNNKRKILRSLEIWHQKGKKHSDIIDDQCKSSTSTSGGGLRYDNALVLWLQCDQNVLDKRLNDRVDGMIEEGLLEELSHFHTEYNLHRLLDDQPPDYTKGIFQAIGFKEFHGYLTLPDDAKATDEGRRTLKAAIDELKLVTRRYARKQIKWTVNRFLSRKDRQVPPIYALDTTDVAQWAQKVTHPAFEIVQSHISGSRSSVPPLPMTDKVSVSNLMDETYQCEVCDRIFVGTFQRDIHMNSRKHRIMLGKAKQQQELKCAN